MQSMVTNKYENSFNIKVSKKKKFHTYLIYSYVQIEWFKSEFNKNSRLSWKPKEMSAVVYYTEYSYDAFVISD